MAHALYTFDLTQLTPHVQVTSTGTGNVVTAVAPKDAVACFVTVSTNAGIVTFDGSAPSGANGLILVKDTAPIFIPIGAPRTLQFASSIAGNSVINILWVT